MGAMSRRKKKMYVKNMENKNKLMERHIAILEMENAQLRALMNHQMPSNMHHHQRMTNSHFPAYKLPVTAMSNFRDLTRSGSAMSESTNNNSSNNSHSNTSSMNSIEPMDMPSNKRRKLNDGTSVNTSSSSPSCDNLSDLDILEPLPVNIENDNVTVPPPSAMPMRYMPMNHMGRMYHPSYVQNMSMMQNMNMNNMYNRYNQQQQQQTMNKVEGIVMNKEVNESKSEEINDNIPPEIVVPRLRLSGEYMSLNLDEEIIDETVDECGSIITFEQETKENKIYL